jgi:hypothetical protein
LLPLAAIGSIGFLLVYFDWRIYAIGAVALALLLLAYFLRSATRLRRRGKS